MESVERILEQEVLKWDYLLTTLLSKVRETHRLEQKERGDEFPFSIQKQTIVEKLS